jgi:putative ABC transport system ATP-binding protein
MAESPLIALEGIDKSYSLDGLTSNVLKNLNLKIDKADMLAILGASGSGKSSLMNIIGLLDTADVGHYLFKQQNVMTLTDDEKADLRNRCIGFVFQQFNLLPRFSAFQNVELPLIYANLPVNERALRVKKALEKVEMAAYEKHRPSQLSGGQQQRVAIARALVNDPEIILADEPTGALDSRTGQSIMDLFQSLNQDGRTIIIVTHDQKVANQCKRQVVLVDGVMSSGSLQ